MKVPTYRRETALSPETGAQALRVQASPAAVSAGTRAASQFFDQATQESLNWYETELRNKRDADEMQALNEADQRMNDAIQAASQMDPDEAETYFDTEVLNIQNEIAPRLDSEVRRNKFNGRVEKTAIARRVGVRRDASNRRIDKQLGILFQREELLQRQIIDAPTQIERSQARSDLNQLYTDAVDKQYLSAADAERRRLSALRLTTKERSIAEINSLGSIEELEAYEKRLLENPPPELSPSTVNQLLNLTQADINEILGSESKSRSLEEKLAGKASEEELFALRLQVDNMTNEELSAYLNRLLDGERPEFLDARDSDNLRQYVKSRINAKKSELSGLKNTAKDLVSDVRKNQQSGLLSDEVMLRQLGQLERQLGDEEFSSGVAMTLEIEEEMKSVRQLNPLNLNERIAELRSDALKDGATPLERELLSVAESFATEMKNGLKSDPLTFARDTGVLPSLGVVNFADVNELQARAKDARKVASHYGLNVPRYTTNIERDQLSEQFNSPRANRGLRLALANNIVSGFGSAAPDVFAELADDSPQLAHIGGLLAQNKGQAANLALAGMDMMQAGDKAVDLTELNTRPAYNNFIGSALGYQEKARASGLQIAKSIYTKKANDQGLDAFDPLLWDESIQLAFGRDPLSGQGGIDEVRGTKTLLTGNLSAQDVEEVLANVTPAQIEELTGLKIDSKAVEDLNDPGFFGPEYKVVIAEEGGYYVYRGDFGSDQIKFLSDADGQELIIPIREWILRYRK